MSDLISDNATNALARAGIYRLLAALYRSPPDTALIDSLRSNATQAILDQMGVSFGPEFATTDAALLRERLNVEYTALFIGPGQHIHLLESVHARTGSNHDGQLYSEQTARVKAFIEATGLRYADDFHELPDHLAAELEFMARLCQHEAEHWQAGDHDTAVGCLRIEWRFFQEHLGGWIGKVTQRVRAAHATSTFYAAVAALTDGLIDFERTTLGASQMETGRSVHTVAPLSMTNGGQTTQSPPAT